MPSMALSLAGHGLLSFCLLLRSGQEDWMLEPQWTPYTWTSKKTFVSVTHERLIITLSGPGIWSKLLNWIRCFLSGCSQRVVLHGCRSEWVDSPVESHRAVSWVQHSFCSCSLSAQGYKKRYNDICR